MKYMHILVFLLVTPLVSTAQIQWATHIISDNHISAIHIVTADMDQDGDLDAIGSDASEDAVYWWENVEGNGNYWTEHVISQGIEFVYCSIPIDIDNDGDLDVICASLGMGNIIWCENVDGLGTSWTDHIISNNFPGAVIVDTADFDLDGDWDVVAAGEGPDGGINWWENQDQGATWIDHDLDNNHARSVRSADINIDGYPDIIAGVNGDLKVFVNNNAGLSWTSVSISNFNHPLSIFSVDLDSDEDQDFLVAGEKDVYGIYAFENINNGVSWEEHIVTTTFDGAHSVQAADINNDYDVDVIGSAINTDDIFWWQGSDGWDSWPENVVTQSIGPYSIFASDINSDGLIDIAGAHDNQFVWYEQLGSPFYQLSVVAPNGSEEWRINSLHGIEWISSSDQPITIELLDGNDVERVISDSTDNDGLFEWIIPIDITPSDNYRVRCSLISGDDQDISDQTFSIVATPIVTLDPMITPVQIPATGGGFWYYLSITNPAPVPADGQAWSEVLLPSGNTYGPLVNMNVSIPANGVFEPVYPLGQWVPGFAPSGVYEFVVHAGRYPNLIVATDSFEFEKLAGTSTASLPHSAWNLADWHNEAWETAGAHVAIQEPLPTEFSVSPAYPNPFNASTLLTVSLPEATELSVVVYDVLGREVATLARGQFYTGNHRFTFETNGLASGFYFIRVSAPSHLNLTQKVMLIR